MLECLSARPKGSRILLLSELLDAAVEAIETFGDLEVMVVGAESEMQVAVAQYELEPKHKRTVFAFMPVEKVDLPLGTVVQ